MGNKFNFFVDLDQETEDIIKSSSKKEGNSKYGNMIVAGRASVNQPDRQDEILEPSGYILDDFLNNGLINLEHFPTRKGDPDYYIGEPIDAYVKDNEFFIKGKLWKDHPKAQKLWDTLLIMKSSGSTRKLGWSIEGKKLEVDPKNKKRITKAKINHVALTFSPVSYNTYADIAKGEQKADYIEAHTQEEIDGKTYLLQIEKDGNIITVNRDYTVNIKPKSMDTDSTRVLIKESLEKKPYRLEDWDTIMKAIKDGWIKNEKIPRIIKNLVKNFIIG